MTAVDEATAGPAAIGITGEPEEPDHPDANQTPRRPHRRRAWFGVAAAVVVAALGVGAWWWVADPSADEGADAPGPVATATVERGTISATETWDGTLARGAPLTVRSSIGGTVTRLSQQGASVGRGDVLYRLDEQPVSLLVGDVPMYRDLQAGDVGVDVGQLEANLADLGYTGLDVDDRYDAATATAVSAWQQAIGADPTGTVARGAVVFAPQGGRIEMLRSGVGDVIAPGAPVLDLVGPDQVVYLEVDVDDLDRLAVDTAVTVVLPDGAGVAGTVAATTVVPSSPDPMADEATAETAVQVEVALADNAPEELIGAAAEVVVAIDERLDVLLVTVTALLALAEGGYGLEVVDDGTTSIVPVETGLFAEGKVEITSPDITEGTVVGVAGR
ncbi:MAG: efflux RND transporter periplasmic adaptor subunit [Acidimicrobiales bacterium]